jgi:hypothetical protein
MTTIAVFGSSRVENDGDDYAAARAVGAALGAAGYTVMTGGYAGVMAGVSQGAAEAGAHVIGVTTAQFDYRRPRPNPWVREEIKYPTPRERLVHLIVEADAYIGMPGGIGTLTEIASALDFIRTGSLAPRPVICWAAFWQPHLDAFLDTDYVGREGKELVHFAGDAAGVIRVLDAFFAAN